LEENTASSWPRGRPVLNGFNTGEILLPWVWRVKRRFGNHSGSVGGKFLARSETPPERLAPEEFALIEAFLNRRSSLPADVRFAMADRIAMQIRPRLSVPPGELSFAEKLLEAIVQERRSGTGYS